MNVVAWKSHHEGTSVDDFDLAGDAGHLSQRLEEGFVPAAAPRPQSLFRLPALVRERERNAGNSCLPAAYEDGAVLRMAPTDGRNALLGTEVCGLHEVRVRHGRRHDEERRVRLAELVVRVHQAEPELGAGRAVDRFSGEKGEE